MNQNAVLNSVGKIFPSMVSTMVKTSIYSPGKYHVFPIWQKQIIKNKYNLKQTLKMSKFTSIFSKFN